VLVERFVEYDHGGASFLDDARILLGMLADAGLLVTPELTAVREAARALTAEDLELAAITDEWVALYDGLAAAVDALETRTTGAET
jgi:hypothetical protein